MLEKVLGEKIYKIIKTKINYSGLNELRIRKDKPIVAFFKGQAYFFSEQGLCVNENEAIIATKQQIEDIIFRASEFSIYSINEELKKGFIVLGGGERIGICGNVISDKGEIKTVNNFSSINIRFPHQIINSSLNAFSYLVDDGGVKNTLILSPPGAGKTTFLRDFVYQLSERNLSYNVLIIDERGEIAGSQNEGIYLGKFADVLSFSDKYSGIIQGIRAMNPHVIITDEIGDINDIKAIKYAGNCGVKILASIHAEDLEDLKNKDGFSDLNNVFERYVVLSSNDGPGTIEGVYDRNFSRLAYWR